MVDFLITRTDNLFPIAAARNPCASERLPADSAFEAEYISPEDVNATKRSIPETSFRLLAGLEMNYPYFFDSGRLAFSNFEYAYSTYRSLDIYRQEEDLKGRHINIIV